MVFSPAQKKNSGQRSFLLHFALLLIFLGLFFVSNTHIFHPQPVFAQTSPTPTPPTTSEPVWVFSPEVTEVGKNAERARELLWWVFTHPPIYNAPILAKVWFISVQICVIFLVFVVVAFGLGFILSSGRGSIGRTFSGISSPVAGVNWISVFYRLALVFLWVFISYLIVLGLVQISEIAMQFIRRTVGGDLFNVIFSGSGNIEDNYINFMGFRDSNPLNWEMANTSLLLIRITSMTYNVMALLLILRAIILWFLLVVAPFLAFLMPFIFIRNVGWIWIGVFFQWLFYGPLMMLFLVTITQVWVHGIPYGFNFGRVDKPEGQVYKTAINILYGGPAQVISPGNTANYVDTYAEYVIALVMLWAAIILPWWLLRIFRDYCCEAIVSGNATLNSIFDRLRQYPPPSPPAPPPVSKAAIAVELPFRESIKEKVKEVEKTQVEEIRVKEISQINTNEIAQALKVAIGSLADVSRLETNQVRRADVKQNLEKLSQPERISSALERERFAALKSELQTRASTGDRVAQSILVASEEKKDAALAAQVSMMVGTRSQVTTPIKAGVHAPTIAGVPTGMRPTTVVGRPAGVPIPTVTLPIGMKTVTTQVSVEDYEEVKKMWLKHYREAPVPETEKIKTREQWLAEESKNMTNISNLLSSSDPKLKHQGFEQVAEILPFLLLGGFSNVETLTYLKAKLEAAKQIMTELEVEEEAKARAKEEVKREEETLVEVAPKKAEEKKEGELAEEKKMELPKEEEKKTILPEETDKKPTN